jgi:hypothetical protein
MSLLYFETMDPLQSLAESGRRNEDVPGWARQPPNSSFPAYSQGDSLRSYPSSRYVPQVCFSTGVPDVSQATLWPDFQPCQQPTEMVDYNLVHEPQMSDESQLKLIAKETAHIKHRRHNQGIDLGCQLSFGQEQMTDACNNILPQIHPVTSFLTVGNETLEDIPIPYIVSHETFDGNPISYDGNNSQSFVSNAWYTQSTPQAVSSSLPFNVHSQDTASVTIPSLNLQPNSVVNSYPPPNVLQHTMEQMHPRVSSSNVPSGLANTYRNKFFSPCPEPSDQVDSNTVVPNETNSTSTFLLSDEHRNTSIPSTVLSLQEESGQFYYHASNTAESDFLPLSIINTPGGDALYSIITAIPAQKPMAVGANKRKRIQVCAPVEGSEMKITSGFEIQVYANPDAERNRNKIRKKTREVTEKIDRACFGCFLRKGKVRKLIDYHVFQVL